MLTESYLDRPGACGEDALVTSTRDWAGAEEGGRGEGVESAATHPSMSSTNHSSLSKGMAPTLDPDMSSPAATRGITINLETMTAATFVGEPRS